jgi:hypothetical protein
MHVITGMNVSVWICVYVCMSEAANSVPGEVVRVKQMFINSGKSAFQMHKSK